MKTPFGPKSNVIIGPTDVFIKSFRFLLTFRMKSLSSTYKCNLRRILSYKKNLQHSLARNFCCRQFEQKSYAYFNLEQSSFSGTPDVAAAVA